MSPGASPDSDAPNVDFPSGSETRKDHLENRNKMRIFWSFPSFLLQAHDALRLSLIPWLCFSDPFGLVGTSNAKRANLLLGSELLKHAE